MSASRPPRAVTAALLALGVTVPFIYYGIQVLAAMREPSYSFVGQAASELGSDLAAAPALFNKGIMVQGAATLLASAGFLVAMLRTGVHPALACVTSAAVALNGVQSLWAGYYPMPDPRHGGHPTFIVGMILLPVLLTASLWRGSGRALKAYFVATLLLLAAMFPIMSGVSGLDTTNIRGLTQRVFTLTVFPPIAVGAAVLLRRLKSAA